MLDVISFDPVFDMTLRCSPTNTKIAVYAIEHCRRNGCPIHAIHRIHCSVSMGVSKADLTVKLRFVFDSSMFYGTEVSRKQFHCLGSPTEHLKFGGASLP